MLSIYKDPKKDGRANISVMNSKCCPRNQSVFVIGDTHVWSFYVAIAS